MFSSPLMSKEKMQDGSLIIFWKLLEQFDTPKRNARQNIQTGDEKILLETKNWSRPDLFPNVKVEVADGVILLSGKLPKDKLAYLIQIANNTGARKVVNSLVIE